MKCLAFIGGYAQEIIRDDELAIGKVKNDKRPYPFHQCCVQPIDLCLTLLF